MKRKVKVNPIDRSTRHVRRASGTVKHFRWKVTLCITVMLVCVLGIYLLVSSNRIGQPAGGVEVVVGSSLMARIDLKYAEQELTLLDALEEVSVRPSGMQTIVITGKNDKIEILANEAKNYSLFVGEDGMVLRGADGSELSNVLRVYMPTDEKSVKRLE